jgi:hypothetical protein
LPPLGNGLWGAVRGLEVKSGTHLNDTKCPLRFVEKLVVAMNEAEKELQDDK